MARSFDFRPAEYNRTMDYTSFAPGSSASNQNPTPPLFQAPQKTFTSKFIALIIGLFVLGGVAYAGIWFWQNQQTAQQVAPTFTPRISSQPSNIYNISLGFLVRLPDSLSDLTEQVVKLSGDQAVNSVALSTTRLESVGCSLSSAPLGYLTYDSDKGGVIVAHARGSDVYYIKPTVQCGGTLQDWSGLQEALKTIISDSCGKGETCPAGFICKTPEGYSQSEATCQKVSAADTSTWKTYRNDQYGFSIALPDGWKGYTVLNSQWEGRDVATGNVTAHGPIVTLRHPLWTATAPREDMPIMVFTPAQWELVQQESLAVGAAPIPPSILGQNSKYIIALPARYNFDYKTGFEEVDQLVHALKAYEPTVAGQFCGGIAGIQCPSGYSCKLEGNYPDAGGTCEAAVGGKACTQDAKKCSDGSYVARTGPNCEFAACPGDGILAGHVTIGPNCPVEQVGHPCTPSPETYAAHEFVVLNGAQKETARFYAGADGNYSIALSPGTYTVTTAKTGFGYMSKDLPSTIVIKNGQTVSLNVSIDTGIR